MISGTILNSKLFRISLICAFFLLAGAFPKAALSQEKTADGQEKKFDAKETILEHIGDSHSWPVMFPFIHETTLPDGFPGNSHDRFRSSEYARRWPKPGRPSDGSRKGR